MALGSFDDDDDDAAVDVARVAVAIITAGLQACRFSQMHAAVRRCILASTSAALTALAAGGRERDRCRRWSWFCDVPG